MNERTDHVKRDISLNDKGEVVMDLKARDVCSKEDFIQIYESRIQNKSMMESNLENAKKQLEQISEIEKDKEVMKVIATIEKKRKEDEKFFEKVFTFIQKEYTVKQIKQIEKALKMIELEFEDMNPLYKIITDEFKELKEAVK